MEIIVSKEKDHVDPAVCENIERLVRPEDIDVVPWSHESLDRKKQVDEDEHVI
jgi:hypothetical protein